MVELLVFTLVVIILTPLMLSAIQVCMYMTKTSYPKDKVKIPPKAMFFNKVNGVCTSVEGGYETKYLSKREEKLWKRNKKKTLKEERKKGKNN